MGAVVFNFQLKPPAASSASTAALPELIFTSDISLKAQHPLEMLSSLFDLIYKQNKINRKLSVKLKIGLSSILTVGQKK